MNGTVRRQVDDAVRSWIAAERGATVLRTRVTRSAYASTAAIFNVHLTLAGGERTRVVCKDRGHAVMPGFLSNMGREEWMYRCFLGADGIADAPRLLGSGAGWLLMEWAGSVDLGQIGSRAVWCEVAARLARLHAWGESRVEELARGSVVRWDDPGLHMRFARRASLSPPLMRRYHEVAQRLYVMPKTLVHGDFNASNVLVTRSPAGQRIRMIDWETAGVGPGLLDLVSLLSGNLPERHRSEMISAYRANLESSRLSAMSAGDFDEALALCRLAQAVRWLGWSPGWSPPAAHAHDWRREALMSARQAGLLDP